MPGNSRRHPNEGGIDMYTSDVVLGDRGYESVHIETVLTKIRKNFQRYWEQFAPNARENFRDTLKQWQKATRFTSRSWTTSS